MAARKQGSGKVGSPGQPKPRKRAARPKASTQQTGAEGEASPLPLFVERGGGGEAKARAGRAPVVAVGTGGQGLFGSALFNKAAFNKAGYNSPGAITSATVGGQRVTTVQLPTKAEVVAPRDFTPITHGSHTTETVAIEDRQPSASTAPTTHTVSSDAGIPIGWGIGPLQAPTLKPDWASHVPEILQAAQAVVSLYSQLDAILGPLKRTPSPPGDNRASERAEVIRQFESDMRAAVWTSEVLREQLQSGAPQPKVVEQNRHVLRVLANNAKRYADWFAGGVLAGLGKYAGEQLAPLIPAMIEHLGRLADLIPGLFT